jgi:hypothetical protein
MGGGVCRGVRFVVKVLDLAAESGATISKRGNGYDCENRVKRQPQLDDIGGGVLGEIGP